MAKEEEPRPAAESKAPARAARRTGRPRTGRTPALLPVLPLSDVVVFPSMIAPLVVSTPRSMKLIEQVSAGDRRLVTVLQRDPQVPDDEVTPAQLHGIGCLARLIKVLRFPDETVRILIQGQSRVRLDRFSTRGPFLKARGRVLRDAMEPTIEIEALARNASQRFQEVISLSPTLPEELKIALLNTDDPARLSDLVAAHLNMPMAERQSLLAAVDVRERLERINGILERERHVLELGNQIQTQVVEAVGKHQREYYLREQLRILRKELGEQDPLSAEHGDLAERIKQANLPEEASEVAEKEMDRLRAVPSASPEYGVIRTYLDWLADMPWRRKTEDELDLAHARRILDRDHYDLARAKERILEFLAVLKLKGCMRGPILCFAGPPGVGKTSLGRSIADALGRSFTRMSLGGVRDEAEIRGHRRTYIGAMPGRIVQGIKRAGNRNPVFMLDEIDKLGVDFRGDPAAALMEVLDPEQNHAFRDHYLDVPFDLSEVFFISTANTLEAIPPALRDRMEVLPIAGYTTGEKRRIAQRHLAPKQFREHGLKPGPLRFSAEALDGMIDGYTREAGVRNLEREIATICRKLARRVAEGRTVRSPISATTVRALLGPRRFATETAERNHEPGVVTGLAWTPAGGEILFVEVTRMPGKGRLTLTGSLGAVMKESAMAAVSHVRARGYGCDLGADFAEATDLHVHVPAGSIAKDGPSAGLAIAAALVSLLRGCPVPADVAMTGEITLRGRVLPVGGVKEKVLAAARAGIRTVVLPVRNRPDLAEIPAETMRSLTFRFVGTVEAAVRHIFHMPRPSRRTRAGGRS